ncbi:MAG: HEAT repeat domain-containing protein [Pirellulaceae bacterium]
MTMCTDPFQLVAALTDSTRRYPSFAELVELGHQSLPALRQGLKSEDWQVRKWCAMCLDQVADTESLMDLLPLFTDPRADVRLWAVHSIACDHCKEDVHCHTDLVPHLVERIENDESIRVRKMATIMLGTEFLDSRTGPVFQRLLDTETDRKIRLHAEAGLNRLRQAGLAEG